MTKPYLTQFGYIICREPTHPIFPIFPIIPIFPIFPPIFWKILPYFPYFIKKILPYFPYFEKFGDLFLELTFQHLFYRPHTYYWKIWEFFLRNIHRSDRAIFHKIVIVKNVLKVADLYITMCQELWKNPPIFPIFCRKIWLKPPIFLSYLNYQNSHISHIFVWCDGGLPAIHPWDFCLRRV